MKLIYVYLKCIGIADELLFLVLILYETYSIWQDKSGTLYQLYIIIPYEIEQNRI